VPARAPDGGFLVLKKPWPGMLRGIWGDPQRYKEQYWSQFEKIYFAGDGAHRDRQGYFWIMGRIDDVMNISGHRIGTMEVESALVSHADVAEAAVVGRPDDLTGTAIVAFVTPKRGRQADGLRGRSAPSRSPPTSVSPTPCPRRARERSCGGCCATSRRSERR
jgi:acetyl-CoA synthetase